MRFILKTKDHVSLHYFVRLQNKDLGATISEFSLASPSCSVLNLGKFNLDKLVQIVLLVVH